MGLSNNEQKGGLCVFIACVLQCGGVHFACVFEFKKKRLGGGVVFLGELPACLHVRVFISARRHEKIDSFRRSPGNKLLICSFFCQTELL